MLAICVTTNIDLEQLFAFEIANRNEAEGSKYLQPSGAKWSQVEPSGAKWSQVAFGTAICLRDRHGDIADLAITIWNSYLPSRRSLRDPGSRNDDLEQLLVDEIDVGDMYHHRYSFGAVICLRDRKSE